MKVALLMHEEGHQVVLTPESDGEQKMLNILKEHPLGIRVETAGAFRMTQGGYFREFDERPNRYSVLLVLTRSAAEQTA